MRRVIDLEYVLPPDEHGVARQYFGAAGHRIGEGDPELLPPRPGYEWVVVGTDVLLVAAATGLIVDILLEAL